MEGFTNVNEGKLIQGLTAFSTVLSLAFMLPTPVILTAGVISAVGNIGSERDMIIQVCRNGEDFLQSLEYFFNDNPEYNLIRVDSPFLEFVDEGFRIIQGNGRVTAVQVNGGWVLL